MSGDGWLTVGVILLTFAALVFELASYELVILGAVTVLMLAGVLTPMQALGGFGSSAVLVVGAMLVVAAGVRRTGLLTVVAERLFGRRNGHEPLLRLMLPAGLLSAFMNNTPIVAMFVPAVLDWCKRNDVAPSRLLMPLSFATMLGGMVTLIGTSTTLVVDGLMRDAGMRGLGMFEIGRVGLPVALAGVVVIWILGPRLLADRRDPVTNLGKDTRQYLVEMLVDTKSPLVGCTIAEAGLRNLGGLFLMNIERAGRFIGPVGPQEALVASDRLVFTGRASTVVELRRFPGLSPAPEAHYDPTAPGRGDRMFEVVVSSSSPLVGTTLKDVGFRSRYDAAVIAVHRAGQRLAKKIGEVEIRAGDTLMLEATNHFEERWGDSSDFALVSRVRAEPAPVTHKAPLALAIVAAIVVLVTLRLVPLVSAAFAAIGLMIVGGLLTAREARKAVDLRILAVIAGAMGLGKALDVSGAAPVLAHDVIAVARQLGPLGILAATYLVTTLVTSLINNVAAAAIMFPVAMAAATQAGLATRPFAITLAVAASAAFLTPTGYQTNLMVYGPGGYRFSDFLRLGLPLQLAVMLVTLVVVPHVWPLR